MVLSSLASPRRLVLLGLFLFVVAVTFLQSARNTKTLPHGRLPSFTSSQNKHADAGLQQTPSQSTSTTLSQSQHTQDADWWRKTFGFDGHPAESQHAPPNTPMAPGSSPTSRTRPSWSALPKPDRAHVQSKILSLLDDWTYPTGVLKYPPYDWYDNTDYDPNAWEGFDWQNDYYINNGVHSLAAQTSSAAVAPTPTPYLPYPNFNSDRWKSQWKGDYAPCVGPRGKPLNESLEDMIHAWPSVPDGFPKPAIGDADVLGIDIDHCFDRFHRFGPYGYGEEEKDNVDLWQQPSSKPDWSYTPWGELQDQCVLANKQRYGSPAREVMKLTYDTSMPEDHLTTPPHTSELSKDPSYRPRTAVLIRAWEGYNYKDNDHEAIRALIAELNLLSGGEYQVFLFVNIKDSNTDIYGNHEVYMDVLKANVPQEFWDIAILWNEGLVEQWYPKVGHWDVYWHQFMPVQWFSKTHPEFDFIWNWETDARYTGNHYHFLEKIADFSRQVPRKYLWERNARFYLPAIFGTYDQFLNDTFATIEQAMASEQMKPVWGPLPYAANKMDPVGPTPPTTLEEDNFEWGVGEEADLITLQPIWEPTSTEWTMRDKIWNFVEGVRPIFTSNRGVNEAFTHPEFKNVPRRAFINTVARFSRRQLHAMHVENLAGRSMQAEQWPTTAALHHGLKAVYAPHPIWTDRKWPSWYMDAIFNADGGKLARWGQESDSVYAHDREHNFHGWSWYFDSAFPRVLYRRWLGWMAEVGPEIQFPTNPLRRLGGRKFEQHGVKVQVADAQGTGESPSAASASSSGSDELVVGGKGRMCLPGMLLHPVKNVYRRAEAIEEEDAQEDGGYESQRAEMEGR